MKKIFLFLLLIQTNIFSQFEYGIKAGLNFNNNLNIKANIESLDEVVNIFESRNGFHVGGFLKLNIGKIYIRPEFTYSKINNSYDLPITLSQQENIISDFKQSKIDIPVLIGYKFFNMINLFAGPRFEYIGKVNFNDLNIDDNEVNDNEVIESTEKSVIGWYWLVQLINTTLPDCVNSEPLSVWFV